MKVTYINTFEDYYKLEQSKKRDVTIGFFDSVHLGHKYIIKTLKDAEPTDNSKVIITFDFHPVKRLIMPINEKISMFENLGVDEVIIIQMNDLIKCTTELEFVDFLKHLNINKIYIGPDFRFGAYAKGNVELLKQNFDVEIIDFIKEDNLKISSSVIRKNIEEGDIEIINKLLGYKYFIKGAVVHGQQLGRKLGFPTANVISEYFIPKFGVYVTRTTIGKKTYNSITNIGNKPTINGKTMSIETNIFDFEGNIYGEFIKIEFIKRIRPETQFNSLEELKMQIEADKEYALREFCKIED